MKDETERELFVDGERAAKARDGRLINEAIKRILLDMVIRGHGDRLIGRWSREPEIQQFLAEVPYLLDRISQLHLACARTGSLLPAHAHHFHHRRRHESREQEFGAMRDVAELLSKSSAGWMVRTRDPLGLTPLHKAVLAENSVLVEFLLDHYKDEPAGPSTRLMDAQDKYGRSALHYAAALAATGKPNRVHLYKLLLSRGASNRLLDFRGKTARDYAQEAAGQLRVRTIIHLANRMNANYQANILSRTLRVGLSAEGEIPCAPDERNETAFSGDNLSGVKSKSCANLTTTNEVRKSSKQTPVAARSRSTLSIGQNSQDWLSIAAQPLINPRPGSSQSSSSTSSGLAASTWSSNSALCQSNSNSNLSEISDLSKRQNAHSAVDLERAKKELIGQRCSRLVMDERAKLTCSRALNDGTLEKLSELLLEGYGSYMMTEAGVSCWNQQCRRYLQKVVPSLLKKLDLLHESIAINDLTSVKSLLVEEPVLARIRRPYKQAAMGAIHVAAQTGRRDILTYLIARFPELLKQRDSLGATCLHWSARIVNNQAQRPIYEWLLRHFGAQLESLEDFKGRKADYYCEQAARLSDFGLGRPRRPKNPPEASELLHHNQCVSNEIKLTGSRCRMESRKSPLTRDTRKRATPTSSNQNQVDDERPVTEVTSPILLPNKNSPPGCDDIESTENNNRDQAQCEDLNEEKAKSELLDVNEKFRLNSRRPSTSIHTSSGERRLLIVQAENKERKPTIEDETQNTTLPDREQEVKRAELLAEMLQLDADDTIDVEVPTTPTSAKTRPVRKQPAENKLELMLRESLKGNDLARLERLILAGYGRRILKLLESSKVLLTQETLSSRKKEKKKTDFLSQSLSDEMLAYLTSRAPELTSLIERIHKLLHECFSHPEHHQIQANFHKLCNLLTCNSLVMSRDQYGATPLHVALLRADKRLVEYLLRRQPEAASAPDHLNRNPLHYAALALSAFKGHKRSFKLTTRKTIEEEQLVQREAHWLVDENAQLTYDNLCSRYRELLSACDSRGRTCEEYLTLGENENYHVQFEDLIGDVDTAGRVKASVAFASCCPVYAKLLDNYSYYLIILPTTSELIQQKLSEKQEEQPDDVKETETLQIEEEEANEEKDAFKEIEKVSEEKLESSDYTRPLIADNIILKDNTHSSTVIPETIGKHDMSNASREYDVVVSTSVKSAPATSDAQSSKQHHKHHHHHHHHHHLHFQERTERDERAQQSLVGGVIVPTIIHNDKMDEIETYDIIYRQPVGGRASPGRCSGGDDIIAKALNLPGSSSTPSGIVGCNEREARSPIEGISQSGARLSRSGSSISSSSSSSSSSSLELDDERVERLSIEFEDRVRKEKCELRLKVDQIMSEIKSSAKSAKSARLLNSPIPPSSSTNNDRPASGTDKSSSSTGVVMRVNISPSASQQSEHKRLSTKTNKQPNKSSATSFSLSGSSSTSTRSTQSNSATSCSSSHSSCSSSACSRHRDVDTPTHTVSSPSTPLVERALKNEPPRSANEHQPLAKVDNQHTASKNAYGQTYLHFIASRAQSASVLYKVLDHARYLIGERDIFYRSARDVALQFNLANNVQVLDKFIIDLFIAANIPLLRHLLNQGYSPLIHVADPDGNDIMLILKLLKLDRMVHFLLMMADFQRWRDELHTFIRHGYSAGVSVLIRKHKDLVRAKSLHSRTSLHLAILFDRMEMISELLLEDPSCVHVTDNMGRTPLHYAYGLAHLANSESIREQLLAAGASLEARDVKMRTPKYYFIFKREIEDIKKMELELN